MLIFVCIGRRMQKVSWCFFASFFSYLLFFVVVVKCSRQLIWCLLFFNWKLRRRRICFFPLWRSQCIWLTSKGRRRKRGAIFACFGDGNQHEITMYFYEIFFQTISNNIYPWRQSKEMWFHFIDIYIVFSNDWFEVERDKKHSQRP